MATDLSTHHAAAPAMCRGRTHVLALALAGAWGFAGCGGESVGARDGATEDAPTLSWTTTEDYRIGGISASDALAFGDVSAVAFGPDGHLFVIDGDAQHVVVIDASGGFVRTLGEPGEGPGSLAWPTGLVVTDEGEVIVLDSARRRWVRFGPDGGVLPGIPIADDIALPRGPLALDPSGRVLGTRDDDVEASGPRRVLLYPLASDAEPIEVWAGWRPLTPAGRPLTAEETGGLRVRLAPLVGFHPYLHAVPLLDGRVVVADSTEYHLRVVDAGGAITDEVARDVPGRTVAQADREAERRRRLAALEADPPNVMVSNSEGEAIGAADNPVMRLERARIDAMGFHDRIPSIHALAVDRDGRLWVERAGPIPGEPGAIDVYAPDLTPIGTLPAGSIAFPAAFGPDDRFAHVTSDDFGAPIVTVSRRVR